MDKRLSDCWFKHGSFLRLLICTHVMILDCLKILPFSVHSVTKLIRFSASHCLLFSFLSILQSVYKDLDNKFYRLLFCKNEVEIILSPTKAGCLLSPANEEAFAHVAIFPWPQTLYWSHFICLSKCKFSSFSRCHNTTMGPVTQEILKEATREFAECCATSLIRSVSNGMLFLEVNILSSICETWDLNFFVIQWSRGK